MRASKRALTDYFRLKAQKRRCGKKDYLRENPEDENEILYRRVKRIRDKLITKGICSELELIQCSNFTLEQARDVFLLRYDKMDQEDVFCYEKKIKKCNTNNIKIKQREISFLQRSYFLNYAKEDFYAIQPKECYFCSQEEYLFDFFIFKDKYEDLFKLFVRDLDEENFNHDLFKELILEELAKVSLTRNKSISKKNSESILDELPFLKETFEEVLFEILRKRSVTKIS